MNRKLIVITGPSGVGKGSLVKRLIQSNQNYSLSVSATTREKRSGEEDGREYFFLSNDEFDELVKNDGFLEWAEFAGFKYGTLRSEVDKILKQDKRVILEIELAGARQIKTSSPEAVFIFIAPPDLKTLEERLKARGTESAGEIARRLEIAETELSAKSEFDFVLVNDDFEDSFKALLNYCESL